MYGRPLAWLDSCLWLVFVRGGQMCVEYACWLRSKTNLPFLDTQRVLRGVILKTLSPSADISCGFLSSATLETDFEFFFETAVSASAF